MDFIGWSGKIKDKRPVVHTEDVRGVLSLRGSFTCTTTGKQGKTKQETARQTHAQNEKKTRRVQASTCARGDTANINKVQLKRTLKSKHEVKSSQFKPPEARQSMPSQVGPIQV